MHVTRELIFQIIGLGFLFRLGWHMCDALIGEFQNALVRFQTWRERMKG